MCAIAGWIHDAPYDGEAIRRTVLEMVEAQRFRGPDGINVWSSARVGLGIARLAIVGSESRGQQPIEDGSGNRLVFNGELYQPGEVMRQLGRSFSRDQSDGVALIEVLKQRGVHGLGGVSAMFALAMYDARDGSVLLARDAWGQKPLYIARGNDRWVFASTIAALRIALGPLRIRDQAIRECLIFKSVGGNGTAFEGIQQVPPGSWLRIHSGGRTESGRWFTRLPPGQATADPERVRALLEQSIRLQVAAGHRSAVFLSGGLDSSIVATVATRMPDRPSPHVFTIGYDVGGWEDEHAYAVRLARELALEHESLTVHGQEVAGLMAEAAVALEDPVLDPVVVPTVVLSRAAAARTKVVLTGDGSDEFWGGYARFDNPPPALRDYLERTMVFHPGEIGSDEAVESYLAEVDVPSEGSMPVLDRIMRVEASNRLRNYHLSRVDKVSMAAGLEARSPFLDIQATSYAETLLAEDKRPGGRPKGLLIDAFRRHLPKWLVNRKKQPFTVPIQKWLEGPLREISHSLLKAPGSYVRRFVDPNSLLDSPSSTEADLGRFSRIWSLLHIEIWHREFGRTMEMAL